MIWDLGWHAFECILAPLRAGGFEGALTLGRVRAARFQPVDGAPSPPVRTAARIDGAVAVGKGLAEESKRLQLLRGNVCETVSLSESGWLAHYHLIHALLSPDPDMGLTLADVTTVVALCEQACRILTAEGPYRFGTPLFLCRGREDPLRNLEEAGMCLLR